MICCSIGTIRTYIVLSNSQAHCRRLCYDGMIVIYRQMLLKVIFALFFGETLAIYGELIAAKGNPWTGLVLALSSVPLLIWAYFAGYKAGGIWQVTATSIASILIAEPILVFTMFREVPNKNALIGCLLGAAGLIVANLKN